MEPLGPARLVPIEPAGDLGSLLAIHRDQRVALRSRPFLYMEERLAVDHRQEHGEEPRRFEMPEDGDRRIADDEVLPQPKDGHRTRPSRNGLDLPGAGELGLGGGQDIVAIADEGQVGGGEGVVEGRSGRAATITGASHETFPLAESGAGSSSRSGRSRLFGREGDPPDGGTVAEMGGEGKGGSRPAKGPVKVAGKGPAAPGNAIPRRKACPEGAKERMELPSPLRGWRFLFLHFPGVFTHMVTHI